MLFTKVVEVEVGDRRLRNPSHDFFDVIEDVFRVFNLEDLVLHTLQDGGHLVQVSFGSLKVGHVIFVEAVSDHDGNFSTFGWLILTSAKLFYDALCLVPFEISGNS